MASRAFTCGLSFVLFAILSSCGSVSSSGSDDEIGTAQASELVDVPIFDADDLNLNTEFLLPHRLLYDPSEGVGGVEDGLFADGLYTSPQVSILLDRTVSYDARDKVRDVIRVRWTANTHPHTDEIIVDAKTLSTINERTRSGSNWQTKDEVTYIRGHKATVLKISDDQPPTKTEFDLRQKHHFGLMILPYLFASMDVPNDTKFRLPTLGTDSEAFIDVHVFGRATFVDAQGNEQLALKVTSKHSWGEIDWFVDREQLPYHLHAIWYFGENRDKALSAVSKVIDRTEFKTDIYSDIVNEAALNRESE